MTTPAHQARVEGDHLTGWRWICVCGKTSGLHGETGAPRRQGNEHARRMLRKAAQS